MIKKTLIYKKADRAVAIRREKGVSLLKIERLAPFFYFLY